MINKAPIDRFTLAHIAGGAAARLMGAELPLTTALAVGWEVIEPPLKEALPGVFPNPTQDTLSNKTFDALAVIVGWGAVRVLEEVNKT